MFNYSVADYQDIDEDRHVNGVHWPGISHRGLKPPPPLPLTIF